jgi:NitT/TauT family transport system ATP-binding protein
VTVKLSTAPMVDVAILSRGLEKRFVTARGEVQALAPTDLQVRRGEFVCIVGPSGCGKTTLLNILGGLMEPSQGSFEFNVPSSERPLFSIVFQEESVYPWLTALDNAAFGLMARGVPRDERREIARRFLASMGLGHRAGAYPHELSGGMRQRVNLARAFANDPEILLMDEPFGALDEQTRLLLQQDLLEMWEQYRKTVVFITHSIDEAIRLADRILVMSARPGRIKASLDVSLSRPRDIFSTASADEVGRLRADVWRHLQEEVLRARAAEEAEVDR